MEPALAAAPPATVPPAAEEGKTRFYIFTASPDLLVFTFAGTVEANDRDQALRKHFGGHPPLSVAVSEHAWKVRKPKIEPVVRGLTDVDMPASAIRAADEVAASNVSDDEIGKQVEAVT